MFINVFIDHLFIYLLMMIWGMVHDCLLATEFRRQKAGEVWAPAPDSNGVWYQRQGCLVDVRPGISAQFMREIHSIGLIGMSKYSIGVSMGGSHLTLQWSQQYVAVLACSGPMISISKFQDAFSYASMIVWKQPLLQECGMWFGLRPTILTYLNHF